MVCIYNITIHRDNHYSGCIQTTTVMIVAMDGDISRYSEEIL